MAKKKNEEQEEPEEIMNIDEEHERLQNNLAALEEEKALFTEGAGEDFLRRAAEKFQEMADDETLGLRHIKPSGLEKAQGLIDGLLTAKQVLTGHDFDLKIKEAQDELDRFEKDNGLLIQKGEA